MDTGLIPAITDAGLDPETMGSNWVLEAVLSLGSLRLCRQWGIPETEAEGKGRQKVLGLA